MTLISTDTPLLANTVTPMSQGLSQRPMGAECDNACLLCVCSQRTHLNLNVGLKKTGKRALQAQQRQVLNKNGLSLR